MDRHESEREDLIREATALLPRAEFLLPTLHEPLTVGFRGAAPSFFFGQNQVYHFDHAGKLRRAFVDGFLFRSQHSGLARLERSRTQTQTTLLRSDLSPEQLLQFRRKMLDTLKVIQSGLTDGSLLPARSMPPDADWIALLRIPLQTIFTADPWLSDTIHARR
jgi:hypothetical protein